MSQIDELASDLPFRLISKTIGRGAYASIRKAAPHGRSSPVFAVKFIHKAFAVRHGTITLKQIEMEVALHEHIGHHHNIIQFFSTGQDSVWRWIAMEYAEGGDLFDKIEADVGVSEDIAHCYFTQLVSAVAYMHSKGVAHRDIKPENVLLSSEGILKLADFGLATLFLYRGEQKRCLTLCGTPPYVAPEVVACGKSAHLGSSNKAATGYLADRVDVWSCGVVLFVLLVGNTPWDEPTSESWEFQEYVRANGRSPDELWQRVAPGALSLLRGMMKVEPSDRFTFDEVRRHPWFTRANPYITPDGKMKSPVSLATQMLGNLKIDLTQVPTASLTTMDLDDSGPATAADAAAHDASSRFAASQPETPTNDMLFDWECPLGVGMTVNASQPIAPTTTTTTTTSTNSNNSIIPNRNNLLRPVTGPPANHHNEHIADLLSTEPSMSQFSLSPGLPISLTQRAKAFQDIVPSHSLTRFISHLAHNLLLPLLSQALHRLGVPHPPFSPAALHGRESSVVIKLRTLDGRRCSLNGHIVVDKTGIRRTTNSSSSYHHHPPPHGPPDHDEDDDDDAGNYLLEVRFVKLNGDPLEWRRFFKKVVVLCKEGVYVPDW